LKASNSSAIRTGAANRSKGYTLTSLTPKAAS
jgi:hypothetical protein